MNSAISFDAMSHAFTGRPTPEARMLDAASRFGGFAQALEAQQSHYSERIQTADTATDRAPADRRTELRDAARKLVASAFLLPLLAQMRDSAFKSDLFSGGRGEEVFGAQLDTVLADEIAAGNSFGLVDEIERRMLPSAERITPGRGHASDISNAAMIDVQG